MSTNVVDLRDLAKELSDLREAKERADADLDEDRLDALEELESNLGGDIEEAAAREPCMIIESHWVTYCEELANDLGYTPEDSPLRHHIDWDGWSAEVKHDYAEVQFDDETYLRRRH